MATVNLGRIKFVWQGAYNGATNYVADDVVSYNGTSYICILASTNNLPTNTTYWNVMSSAGTNGTNGTNGTDVGTVITTQGDLLYRNASGLARLGAGTNGQVLTTAGASANPSWSTVSSDVVLLATATVTSSSTYANFDNLLTDTYPIYKVYAYGVRPSSSARASIQAGYGSTPTYITSNYSSFSHGSHYNYGGSGDANWYDGNSGLSYWDIRFDQGDFDENASYDYTFYNMRENSSTKRKSFHCHSFSKNSGWNIREMASVGHMQDSTGDTNKMTSLRFSFLSGGGTINSGTFKLYGIK